jgi:recombination protein RecR
MINKKQTVMEPLAQALQDALRHVKVCDTCGNIDTIDPCAICQDSRRETGVLCVVEDVADLWALERAIAHKGRYHVLGGTLSALDGVGPDDLNIAKLVERARVDSISEVVLATNATVEGQTTANYIMDRLAEANVTITRVAHGVPVGGELDYMDDGTLAAAMKSRRPL